VTWNRELHAANDLSKEGQHQMGNECQCSNNPEIAKSQDTALTGQEARHKGNKVGWQSTQNSITISINCGRQPESE